MRGTVAVAAVFGVLAGCGLATSGLEGAAPADAGTPGVTTTPPMLDATLADSGSPAPSSNDGAMPGDDAGPSSDDATVDSGAVPPIDSGGGDACSETRDAGALATILAWPVTKPPKIDGDLSEWPCEGLIQFSDANSAYVKTTSHPLTANAQVRWDMQNIYVAMHVVDSTVGVGGYDPVDPYNNDSVEVYVSGDPALDGDYDALTHQYVTDYQALIVDYGPTHSGAAAVTNPPHFSAAAMTVSDGWNFEAAIGWQAVLVAGMSSYASGTTLALDFEVNDGNGTSQVAAIVFTLAPAQATCTCVQAQCCCGQTPDLPSCDSGRFGRATLQ